MHYRGAISLLDEMRKYRQGDAIPVYHNICGRRTTYVQCSCDHCRQASKEPPQ